MSKVFTVFTIAWSIAHVGLADSRGEDLLLAAEHDLTRVVQHLVEQGTDPGLQQGDTGMTALMLAAFHGNVRTLETLLQTGAAVESRDRRGYSALSYAVVGGSAAAVRRLIEAGADVDARSSSGATALDLARWRGGPEIVRLLRQAGSRESSSGHADPPSRQDRELWTARLEAMKSTEGPRLRDSDTHSGETGIARLRELESTLELWEQVPRFPWPPPRASASASIPRHLLTGGPEAVPLQDVAQRLERVLEAAGYSEKRWYAVPDGFALVSRIEQINADATSMAPPDRWSIQVAADKVFSLRSYLEALFSTRPGYFRVIVFIVTPYAVTEDPAVTVTREQTLAWLSKGALNLPAPLRSAEFSIDHGCSALIYEFEQLAADSTPSLRDPSPHLGKDHLLHAKLLDALEEPRKG